MQWSLDFLSAVCVEREREREKEKEKEKEKEGECSHIPGYVMYVCAVMDM